MIKLKIVFLMIFLMTIFNSCDKNEIENIEIENNKNDQGGLIIKIPSFEVEEIII